jgi:hypothetical protein
VLVSLNWNVGVGVSSGCPALTVRCRLSPCLWLRRYGVS